MTFDEIVAREQADLNAPNRFQSEGGSHVCELIDGLAFEDGTAVVRYLLDGTGRYLAVYRADGARHLSTNLDG